LFNEIFYLVEDQLFMKIEFLNRLNDLFNSLCPVEQTFFSFAVITSDSAVDCVPNQLGFKNNLIMDLFILFFDQKRHLLIMK